MFTTLPSFTFSTDPMVGFPAPPEVPRLTLSYYQGSTMVLDLVLYDVTIPITLDRYDLVFVLKKSIEATNVIYRHAIEASPKGAAPGMYRVILPKAVSDSLSPGVYYYAIQVKDRGLDVYRAPLVGTFTVELSAASPNPKLGIQDGEPTADGPGGATDEKLVPAEITGPGTPDIGLSF